MWYMPCAVYGCVKPSMECAALNYGVQFSLARLRCAVCRVVHAVCRLWLCQAVYGMRCSKLWCSIFFGTPEVCRVSCGTCRVPSMECATLNYCVQFSLARLRCAVCRVVHAVCRLWLCQAVYGMRYSKLLCSIFFGTPEVCRVSCGTCRVPSMEGPP